MSQDLKKRLKPSLSSLISLAIKYMQITEEEVRKFLTSTMCLCLHLLHVIIRVILDHYLLLCSYFTVIKYIALERVLSLKI